MRYFLLFVILFMSENTLKAEPSSNRIAAVVNNRIITQNDLMNRLRFAAISSGLEPSPENLERMKPEMLRVMIDEQLQLQVGKKYGIEITDDHVQAAIDDIEKSNGMPSGAIANLMSANNIPSKVFENQLKAQLTWLIFIREKYPLKTLEDQVGKTHEHMFAPSLQIADWEIDQELKLQKEKEIKTQYHLAEIVLPFDHPDQEETVKNNLNQLLEELGKGANFPALARQFSQSGTAAQGGDMGWLTEDQLEPEIKETLSHMSPGQLSSPIRTTNGYMILAFIEQKLPESEGETLFTIQQVLLPFPKEVSEEKARAIMVKADGISKKAKNCSDLEKMAKADFPQARTQLRPQASLSNFIEPLQKILMGLDPNQSSEPLLTDDGALLVMVCEKNTETIEELSREDAKAILASRKHALLARRELRDLKRQAFIDIRL